MANSPEFNDTREAFAPDYRRPLGLDSWQRVFNPENGALLGIEEMEDMPLFKRASAHDLATAAALESVRTIANPTTRYIAELALMSTISDQASRNDRYNVNPTTHDRIREMYGEDKYREIVFGTASIPTLAEVVADDDIPVTSVELARHSHGSSWKIGEDVNKDTRKELFGSDMSAVSLSYAPHYKIKGFYDQAALIERKRKVVQLFGGEVVVVMRINMLIDQRGSDIPAHVSQLIDSERAELENRKSRDYDFSQENRILKELLDKDYVRTPVDKKKRLDFLTPLQTGYYAYSIGKLAAEKQADHAAKQEKYEREAANRAYWSGQ